MAINGEAQLRRNWRMAEIAGLDPKVVPRLVRLTGKGPLTSFQDVVSVDESSVIGGFEKETRFRFARYH